MGESQPSWPPASTAASQMRWPAPLHPVPVRKPIPPWLWWSGGMLALALLVGAVWSGIKLWRAFQGAGREQITQLHHHMTAQDAAAIFAEADPAYQKQVGRDQSDELFQVIHDHMGDPLSYTVNNVNVSTNSKSGEIKDLILETKFSKGMGVEHLRYRNLKGVWRMLAYQCNSDLLSGVHLKNVSKPPPAPLPR